jgi:hypothetical protein
MGVERRPTITYNYESTRRRDLNTKENLKRSLRPERALSCLMCEDKKKKKKKVAELLIVFSSAHSFILMPHHFCCLLIHNHLLRLSTS